MPCKTKAKVRFSLKNEEEMEEKAGELWGIEEDNGKLAPMCESGLG